MSLTFKEEVKLAFFDKVLIGLLVLGASFFLNSKIELVKESLIRGREDRNALISHQETRLKDLLRPLLSLAQKDDAVFPRMYDKSSGQPVKTEDGRSIEKDIILPNHDAIMSLLEKNSYLIENDAELQKAIGVYYIHIAVLKELRKNNDYSDPYYKGAPYPKDFTKTISDSIKAAEDKIVGLRKIH